MRNPLPRWYWLLYLILVLGVGYGHLIRKLVNDSGGFSSRYTPPLVATLIVLAVLARARGVALWRPWPWKALCLVLALVSSLALAFAASLAMSSVHRPALLLLALVGLLLPAVQQTYLYAFRSPRIWERDRKEGASGP
jgi:peptidoglycan/LPS O-acetylase OafA/YrhL